MNVSLYIVKKLIPLSSINLQGVSSVGGTHPCTHRNIPIENQDYVFYKDKIEKASMNNVVLFIFEKYSNATFLTFSFISSNETSILISSLAL